VFNSIIAEEAARIAKEEAEEAVYRQIKKQNKKKQRQRKKQKKSVRETRNEEIKKRVFAQQAARGPPAGQGSKHNRRRGGPPDTGMTKQQRKREEAQIRNIIQRRRLQQGTGIDESISHLASNAQPEIAQISESLEGGEINVVLLGLAIIPVFFAIYFVYKRLTTKVNQEDPEKQATKFAVRASLV